MTVREVEQQLGTTRANIRYYEKEGLIFPKRNPLNDYRDYSGEDVEMLRRILFLRNLGIPVQTIRLLINRKADMREVLADCLVQMNEQKCQMSTAQKICEQMLWQKELSIEELPLDLIIKAESIQPDRDRQWRDVLTELWFFWDKLVVWGFLAIQALYTVIVFPFLPEQIPVSWSGLTVTEYGSRVHFLVYLLLSAFLICALRQIVYRYLAGGLRCYMDEVNAIVTVGGLGVGFCEQVYVVLFLRGTTLEVNMFLLICAAGYLAIVGMIVLLYGWSGLHGRGEK